MDANVKLTLNQEIDKELTYILYRNLTFGLGGIIVISCILFWQVYGAIPSEYFIPWFVILNINLFGGFLVIYWYQKTKHKDYLLPYHFYAYVAGSSVTAIMLGILGSFLMPTEIIPQMLCIIIIIGITGASVQNLHASYLASGCYLSFSLGPLLIWEIIHTMYEPHIYLGVFVATFTFAIYLAIDIHTGYKMLLHNIKLKFETRNQYIMMELLSNMMGEFQRCTKEEDLYKVFSTYIRSLFYYYSVTLYVILPQKTEFVLMLSTHAQGPNLKLKLAKEDCLALVDRIPHDSNVKEICPHLETLNKSAICVPMVTGNEVIGLLSFIIDKEIPSQDKKITMYRIAGDFTLAITNLRLRNNLNYLSIHDPLTGIYNRYYLDMVISKVIENARDQYTNICILLIDIDHFKLINDSYGHTVGDQVLVIFSQFLKNFFHDTELIFRYGGEEFLIILEKTSLEDCLTKMNDFRNAIMQFPIELADTHFQITVSGGLVIYPDHGVDTDTLLKMADKALYKAKYDGRDRIYVAETEKSKVE